MIVHIDNASDTGWCCDMLIGINGGKASKGMGINEGKIRIGYNCDRSLHKQIIKTQIK